MSIYREVEIHAMQRWKDKEAYRMGVNQIVSDKLPKLPARKV